jgi:hypothetical protein
MRQYIKNILIYGQLIKSNALIDNLRIEKDSYIEKTVPPYWGSGQVVAT